MKKLEISYQLQGQITKEVPDDFEATDENVKEILSNTSDANLVENIDNAFSFGGIDEDAISVTNVEIQKEEC